MLKVLLEFFIPLNGDPETLRRHRIGMSLAIVALCFSTAAAYGLVPHFSGFAYASALQDIKVDLLEERVFDNRMRQCTAATPEGRQFYGEKTSGLMRKYRELTGYIYPLPSCREIQ